MDFYKYDDICVEKMKALKEKSWDFENLAFEGGGAKVVAYAGSCKILEELGVLQKCKRFAGTSGGAIAAALLATGHTPDEMRELMGLPMEDLLLDSWWGRFSIIPNLWRKFGWCEAKGFLDKMKDILGKKTGYQDLTFKQVYDMYGKELCIVATNVTTSTVEFFHPKTTPHMSVALAVRCSVSLPGLLQPVEVTLPTGLKQLYVDGGVVLNFPLHAFDGWALSMNKEDTLFKNLNKGKQMFGSSQEINERTLGVNLYTFAEDDVMKNDFIQRTEGGGLTRPSTTLSRQRSQEAERLLNDYGQQTAIVTAVNLFLKVLQEKHTGLDDNISLDTFDEAVEEMQDKYKGTTEVLFQKEFTLEKARELIKSNNNKMNMDEMIAVVEKNGFRWSQLLFGGVQTKPASTKQFAVAVLNSCMGMSRMISLKPGDSDRTIGIFTDYIYTADFKLEKEDIDYLVKQGQIGTIEYFAHILKKTKDPHHLPGIQLQRITGPVGYRSSTESNDDMFEDDSMGEPNCDVLEKKSADEPNDDMMEDFSSGEADMDIAKSHSTLEADTEKLPGNLVQGYSMGGSMQSSLTQRFGYGSSRDSNITESSGTDDSKHGNITERIGPSSGMQSNISQRYVAGSSKHSSVIQRSKAGSSKQRSVTQRSGASSSKTNNVASDTDIMQKIFNLTHGDR